MADLSQFAGLTEAQEEGIDVALRLPNGDPIGATIRVAGPDSKRQRAARQRIISDRMKSRSRQSSVDELEAEAMTVTVASVISWEGIEENGASLECTRENVKHVFATYPFIREQVEAAIGDRSVFMKS